MSAQFEALFQKANEAGVAAAEARVPRPMVVVQRANALDNNSPVVKRYEPVMGGVCGFAWVKLRPATSAFARWAKKNKGFRSSYYGGLEMSVSAYGQSMEKKEAYASAFAKVLSEAGYQAYGDSRMD